MDRTGHFADISGGKSDKDRIGDTEGGPLGAPIHKNVRRLAARLARSEGLQKPDYDNLLI